MKKSWTGVAIGLMLVAVVGACADDESEQSDESTVTETEVVESTTTESVEPDPEPDPPDAEADGPEEGDGQSDLVVFDPEAAPDAVAAADVAMTFPALGGLRVGVDADVEAFTEGDMVWFRRPGLVGQAILARTSAAGPEPITSVDDLLAISAEFAGAVGTPVLDDQIEWEGVTLSRYDFTQTPDAPPPVGPGTFSARPFGVGGNAAWTAGPYATLWLGEVEGGVLVVGGIGMTSESAEAAVALVSEVASAAYILSPEGIAPLPTDGFTVVGEFGHEPVVSNPDGPPVLDALFTPIEPGPYQSLNLALPMSVDVPSGWWVMPNFPGFVVLVDGETGPPVGPGARDISFLQDANAITSVGTGLAPIGELVEITDIEAFLANPPPGLVVSSIVSDAIVGGRDAVRFDVAVEAEAGCDASAGCAFIITSPLPNFIRDIKSGAVHRMWWVDDTPGGALLISAATFASDESWLDAGAQALIDGITFG